MTLNFAELTQKMRAGEPATKQDILDVVTAGPGATFALIEFAAEFRRKFFRNTVEVVNLIDAQGNEPAELPTETHAINVGAGESNEELAQQIFALAHNDDAPRVTVNFLVPGEGIEAPGASSLTPMQCLRVLAAVRLAAPAKSLRVGSGRDLHLRSLQALAMHVIDSLYLRDFRVSEPPAVFEDLKLLSGAGLVVLGAENRDLAADYVAYLRAQGVDDAQGYADVILAEENPADGGGCGGNCGCGSGGCGSSEPAEAPQSGGCGCGGGGCGR